MPEPQNVFDPYKGANGELFKGEFSYVHVIDPARPGHTGNHVIDRTKPFDIEIEWQLSGNDVGLYLEHGDAAPNWRIDAFAESMGPGPDIILPGGTEPKGEGADPKVYKHTINVPVNTLPEHIPATQSGVYKLVITVFLNNTDPLGYDICGFHESSMIMVEAPV